jgi:hypothetical protein
MRNNTKTMNSKAGAVVILLSERNLNTWFLSPQRSKHFGGCSTRETIRLDLTLHMYVSRRIFVNVNNGKIRRERWAGESQALLARFLEFPEQYETYVKCPKTYFSPSPGLD